MRARADGRRAGVTLVELILATGLAALVVSATVSIVNSTLELWTRGETLRQARETGTAVLSLVGRDLRQLHGGEEGDLVVDWELFDVERDGEVERHWPRLRFVRDASPREVARIERRRLAYEARAERDRRRAAQGDDAEEFDEALSEEELRAARGVTLDEVALGMLGAEDVAATGLVEVLYAVVPEADRGPERYLGVLYRSERVDEPDSAPVLLGSDAFDRSGLPDLTLAREVARGVLWMRPLLATQTTMLGERGWTTGEGVAAAATSWDAWRRGRPDLDVTEWNEPSPGMPRRGARPLLPRRVLIELEIQRPQDRERAPRLLETTDEGTTSLLVTSGASLVRRVGTHVLVGGEWLRVTAVRGDRITVRRGQRGTARRTLKEDALVLFGESVVIDVPVPLHEDDWRLIADGEDDG
ncbi:MAG: hypothetical protein AAGB93_02750 [Planctomycetota bacterium]